MASPRPSAPVEGTGPPRSLPGFAALLRPRTDSTHAHSDGGAEIYAPPSSVFASSFHNHFHPHQYGLLNLRPPVVASPPPSPFDSLGSYAMFKPRKLDVTTSPSSAAQRTGPSSASSSSPSTSPPAPSSSATPLKHRGPHPRPSARTSRYLREIDRRAILERIAKGEKQADLAKEYQVSRAAISNLKQRRKVKERQLQRQGAGRPHGGDQDNDAADTEEEKGDEKEEEEGSTDRRRRHRHESSADNSSIPAPLTHNNAADAAAVRAVAALRVARQDPLAITPPASSSPAGDVSTSSISSACLVHTSSTAHLLKQLQHGNASSAVAAQRLARLLLEEALGRLPTREGAATRPPVCAIAINDGGGSQLLLDEFRVIEPQCGVGAVQTQTQTQPRPLKASMVSAPEQLSYANVLLIDLVCSETGDEICAAIEALTASGVAPHNVSVATLVGYASGLARVRHAFPQLNAVLTTKVMPPSSATSGGAANGRCSDPAADLTWLLHTRLTE